MRVVMRYGKKGLPLDLPDDWLVDVIAKKPMPVMADVDAALADVLRDPLGDEAAGCRTACILICDITRPVPNTLILPPLITSLVDSGIAPEDVTVLVATGLHRPSTDDELEKLVGDWTLARVKVANHFARNDDDHSYLGETTRGTPVRLDRRFLDTDLRVVIGLVEPHFMAGYSGGRKLIAPGIAHHSTITSFHRAELLSHPSAANCVLEGNPVHEELLEIASMAGKALAVNVVLDDERRLSFLN
jgi:nickel-dependent lactate racemase